MCEIQSKIQNNLGLATKICFCNKKYCDGAATKDVIDDMRGYCDGAQVNIYRATANG